VWERLLADRYITTALVATGHTDFARQLLGECIDDFKTHGIYEDVDYGTPATSRGVLNYTASATNVLKAAIGLPPVLKS
jgi:hypothetical protein